MRLRGIFLSVFLFFTLLGFQTTDVKDYDEYVIRSGSQTITPAAEEKILPVGRSRHLVVQFYDIPDADHRRSLEEKGIKLISYLDGNAYISSVTADGDLALPSIKSVRAVLDFDPDMKLSPLLKKKMEKLALTPDKKIPVLVVFHEDVPFAQARDILEISYIAHDQYDYQYFQTVEIQVSHFDLMQLLSTDEVKWADSALPPPVLHNVWAAQRVNVSEIWNKQTYKKPTGKGIRVGVWDGAAPFKHKDFKKRLTIVEKSKEVSEHATHVIGTIAGSGKKNKDARGMATACNIYSYEFRNGSFLDEMLEAVNIHNIRLSNHSWGKIAGWYWSTEEDGWVWTGDEFFGYYHTETNDQDRLVRDTNLLIIRSAGNDRDDACLGPYKDMESEEMMNDTKPSDPDYGSMTPHPCGKNVVAVGALMKDDAMLYFSNWGPTDDGRIKPDVVATGRDLLSCMPKNKYATYSGTSMAAPVVSGTAALLMSVYRSYIGGNMGSALAKCLLIHTARDLGRKGPDYAFGFGAVDAKLAADIIKTSVNAAENMMTSDIANLSSQIEEESISHDGQVSYTFTVPSNANELRVTLVWHDPEGPRLVNDLDLWIQSPAAEVVRPFTLDPDNPEKLAERGINDVDNVEHILVENPLSGEWTVYVKGTQVPTGPQDFALIMSAGDGNQSPPMKNEGTVSIIKAYAHSISDYNQDEKKKFKRGDEIYFKVAFYLEENSNWGSFHGTVNVKWEVIRKNQLIFKSNSSYSSLYALDPGWYWMLRKGLYIIPTGMKTGNYELKVTVSLHNGETDTKTFKFKVKK